MPDSPFRTQVSACADDTKRLKRIINLIPSIMKIVIINEMGNQIASFNICSEYGYEQFIIDNSLKGCKVINEWCSEVDRNGNQEMHFPNEEILIQLG